MLKLNIYDKGNVVKTYEAETADILYGTVEDLIAIVDVDKMGDAKNKEAQLEIGKMVFKIIPMVKPFLKEIFVGLTDEEIRMTKTKELIPLFVEIVKYTFEEIMAAGGESGN